MDFLADIQSQHGKVTLQIQRVMVDDRMDLCDTTAGRAIDAKMIELIEKYHVSMSNADPKSEDEMRRHEAEDAQAALRVDYDILSKEKVEECGDLLKGVEQHLKMARKARERKETEIAQSDREAARQGSELEYNEARPKVLDREVERLKGLGRTSELKDLLQRTPPGGGLLQGVLGAVQQEGRPGIEG